MALEAFHLVRMARPLEWARIIELDGQNRTETHLIDGDELQTEYAPDDQFRIRIPMTEAANFKTFTWLGWSLILVWYSNQ